MLAILVLTVAIVAVVTTVLIAVPRSSTVGGRARGHAVLLSHAPVVVASGCSGPRPLPRAGRVSRGRLSPRGTGDHTVHPSFRDPREHSMNFFDLPVLSALLAAATAALAALGTVVTPGRRRSCWSRSRVRAALIPVGISMARADRARRRLAPRLAELQKRWSEQPRAAAARDHGALRGGEGVAVRRVPAGARAGAGPHPRLRGVRLADRRRCPERTARRDGVRGAARPAPDGSRRRAGGERPRVRGADRRARRRRVPRAARGAAGGGAGARTDADRPPDQAALLSRIAGVAPFITVVAARVRPARRDPVPGDVVEPGLSASGPCSGGS